jgi:hypothetical protein
MVHGRRTIERDELALSVLCKRFNNASYGAGRSCAAVDSAAWLAVLNESTNFRRRRLREENWGLS